MYLTAQRVWSQALRRSAIHAFLYRHARPLSSPVDIAKIAFRNPGELVASHVELPPGGNQIQSYLDVAAATEFRTNTLPALLKALEVALPSASKNTLVTTLDEGAARLHWTSSISSPQLELAELGAAILSLHSKTQQKEPLVIRVARSERTVRYSLDPASQQRVRELLGPSWAAPPGINVDVDTLDAFEQARGPIHVELIPILTGLDVAQAQALGGIEVVTDTGRHLLPLEPEEEEPKAVFAASEVTDCLTSTMQARRTKGFVLAEGALTLGATLPSSVLSLIEGIALEPTASREDRWRAIELLRSTVLRTEVRTKLLREWASAQESTLGPLEYDSGPVPMLLRDAPESVDEVLNVIEREPIRGLNRFVVRDVLVAMRAELQNNADAVWEDQARRWRRFAQRAVADRDSSQMTASDPLLVESITRQIDERRTRRPSDHAAALWAFDQLRLRNAQVRIKELWHHDGAYLVQVPGLAQARAYDGTPLLEWFRRHHPLSVRISVTEEIPDGWIRVEDQTLDEFIQPVSALKNVRDAFVDLCLALPRSFPEFDLLLDPLRVVTAQPLQADELQDLQRIWEALHLPPPCLAMAIPHFVPSTFKRQPQGDIELIPSRRLPLAAGAELRRLVEADEDTWIAQRRQLYSDDGIDAAALLPDDWKTKRARCIVPTSAFPAHNIRNYLSMFQEVVLVGPLSDRAERLLTSLRCSSQDILELMATGRVRMLLPQSVDRYDLAFLSKAAEQAPKSLLFSRTLGMATVAEARARNPLLYPLLSPRERTLLVQALASFADSIPDSAQAAAVRVVVAELGRIYADAESWLHQRGAMMTMQTGVGTLTAAIWKALRGQDLFIEFSAAAPTVEWGALLNATVFPVESAAYSEARASELIAGFFSGVPQEAATPTPRDLQEVLTGVLSVDNDAPLADFVTAFSGSDVDRLRTLLTRITSENTDAQARTSAVEEFNRAVRLYEKNIDKTKAWDLLGLLQTIGPFLLPGPAKYAGIGAWLLKRLLQRHDLGQSNSATVGRIVDRLNAPLSREGADVVLVSRLKKKLGAMS